MNVLAIGAHWDDIEIGCGLTVNRLRKRGAMIYGAVLTASDYHVVSDNHIRERCSAADEGRSAFDELKIVHIPTTPLLNQKMSYDQSVMQELEAIVIDKQIDLVFTHWHGDHNTDHSAAWEISRVACRRVPNLLQYQSNSYFDNVNQFVPHYFWGFTEEEYQYKKYLMSLHATEWEYRKERWEKEIFNREMVWGYQCGHEYAEAFMISRMCDSQKVSLC